MATPEHELRSTPMATTRPALLRQPFFQVLYREFVSGTRPVYGAPPYAVRAEVGPFHFGYQFFGSTLYVPLGRSFFRIVP